MAGYLPFEETDLSTLYQKTSLEKNLLGSILVSLHAVEARAPPHAFALDPLMPISGIELGGDLLSFVGKDVEGNSTGGHLDSNRINDDIVEVDGPSSKQN